VGHLGYFQTLTIVKCATMNVVVQVALLYPGAHSHRYKTRSVITGFYGISILVVCGICKMIFTVDKLIYIPTNSVRVFRFPTSLPAFVVVLCCWCWPFWVECDGISMSFWFTLPLCPKVLSSSLYVYWTFVLLLGITFLIHFFIGSLNFGEFSFWAPCVFWLLICCQM
jgi:hypothetical protein